VFARSQLARVTRGEIDRLAFAWPPQHGKTKGITVPYAAWRMLREPGLRVGVGAHTQKYAEKISGWIKKVVERGGGEFGAVSRKDEWELTNGSTFIARGVSASIAGESLDLFMIDDVFGSRQDADSVAIQEAVYEWYMDDITPRLQKRAALVAVNTRWGVGDLFGNVLASEDGPNWVYHRIPAIGETQEERDDVARREGQPVGVPDPVPRQPGEALCDARYPLAKLEQKRRIEGVGFESLYQQNPIARGGGYFQREWFGIPAPKTPDGKVTRVRYWDLARSRKDSACFTAGVLMAKVGGKDDAVYYVEDVVRGRWMPAERNEVMLATAVADKKVPGFRCTYFEEPTHDTAKESGQAIVRKLAGHTVIADRVTGSKEMRAEPLATAAKGGIVKVLAGAWTAAYLTEMESFPRGTYKDQVDSSSGAFNQLAAGGGWDLSALAGR